MVVLAKLGGGVRSISILLTVLFYGLLARYNYTVHPKDGGFSFLIARDCIRTFSQLNFHSFPRISNWLLSRREGSPFILIVYSRIVSSTPILKKAGPKRVLPSRRWW